MGFHQSILTNQFPELASILKARHRDYIAIRVQVRKQFLCGIVSYVAKQLHENGVYPSFRHVTQGCPRIISFRDEMIRTQWKNTLRELGYEI